MKVQHSKNTLAAAAMLLACGCGDGGGDASAADAGKDGGADAASDAATEASVEYRGVTHGGRVPDAPDYVEPKPADGPFEVDMTCCDRTLTFAAQPDETEAVLEADFDVLDGVMLTLADGKFTTEQCMPEGTAIQYRLVVTADTDGGTVEYTRVDPDKPSLEDAEGDGWNLYVLKSCN